MLNIERKEKILNLLYKEGKVEVNNLSKMFNVTGATIRRDLRDIEKKGIIERAYGGAIIKKGTLYEPSFKNQLETFINEKEKIANEAAKLISEGDAIFLDSSTTVLYILKNIKMTLNITVVTNSIPIAYELSHHKNIELIILGGVVRTKTGTIVGPIAEKNIKEFKIDKAFLGISAINIKGEMTDPNIYEAQMKKNIIEVSRTIIGVTDHSKFGKESFSFVAHVSKLNKIITDKKIPSDFIKMIKKAKIELIRV